MRKRPSLTHVTALATVALSATLFAIALAVSPPAAAHPSSLPGARTFTTPSLATQRNVDPSVSTLDDYGPADLRIMAEKQARFDAWLAQRQSTARLVTKAPLNYGVSTPLHLQQTGYWCGPATVEIVDDKWGPIVSGATETARQQVYANYMGTTTDGTNFTLVDNALNYFITEPNVAYIYRADMGSASAIYDCVQYDVGVTHYPLAADLRIDPTDPDYDWAPYRLYHSGHIVPIDGYNYNTGIYTIRLNDPNDESHWHPGAGGATAGRHAYPRRTLAHGVISSMRPDLIW
jgi:hypothetical protein